MLERLLPAWDSLQSVAAWQRGFQIIALVAALIAAAFQSTAWVFGGQRDRLAEARDRERSEQAAQKQAANDSALTQARAHIVELEEKVTKEAPRTISTDQHANLVHALAPFPAHDVWIITTPDREPLAYAQKMINVFRDAGWNVQSKRVSGATPAYGLICEITPPGDAAAATLVDAFRAASIPLIVQAPTLHIPVRPNTPILLFIGYKPIS